MGDTRSKRKNMPFIPAVPRGQRSQPGMWRSEEYKFGVSACAQPGKLGAAAGSRCCPWSRLSELHLGTLHLDRLRFCAVA